eukprot:jgi/Mesen1/1530/ME000133S00546
MKGSKDLKVMDNIDNAAICISSSSTTGKGSAIPGGNRRRSSRVAAEVAEGGADPAAEVATCAKSSFASKTAGLYGFEEHATSRPAQGNRRLPEEGESTWRLRWRPETTPAPRPSPAGHPATAALCIKKFCTSRHQQEEEEEEELLLMVLPPPPPPLGPKRLPPFSCTTGERSSHRRRSSTQRAANRKMAAREVGESQGGSRSRWRSAEVARRGEAESFICMTAGWTHLRGAGLRTGEPTLKRVGDGAPCRTQARAWAVSSAPAAAAHQLWQPIQDHAVASLDLGPPRALLGRHLACPKVLVVPEASSCRALVGQDGDERAQEDGVGKQHFREGQGRHSRVIQRPSHAAVAATSPPPPPGAHLCDECHERDAGHACVMVTPLTSSLFAASSRTAVAAFRVALFVNSALHGQRSSSGDHFSHRGWGDARGSMHTGPPDGTGLQETAQSMGPLPRSEYTVSSARANMPTPTSAAATSPEPAPNRPRHTSSSRRLAVQSGADTPAPTPPGPAQQWPPDSLKMARWQLEGGEERTSGAGRLAGPACDELESPHQSSWDMAHLPHVRDRGRHLARQEDLEEDGLGSSGSEEAEIAADTCGGILQLHKLQSLPAKASDRRQVLKAGLRGHSLLHSCHAPLDPGLVEIPEEGVADPALQCRQSDRPAASASPGRPPLWQPVAPPLPSEEEQERDPPRQAEQHGLLATPPGSSCGGRLLPASGPSIAAATRGVQKGRGQGRKQLRLPAELSGGGGDERCYSL